MKTNISYSILAITIGLMSIANTASALNACIIDGYNDQYNISIANYNGPGNIKSVTGTVYFGMLLFNISGSCDKSVKTLYLTSRVANQDYDVFCFVYDTMKYTDGFYTLEDHWGFCLLSGTTIVHGTVGSCGNPARTEASGNSIKGIPYEPSIPQKIEVVPNPIADFASISYSVKDTGEVSISIYNHLGQLVKVIAKETLSTGTYTVHWDITDSRNMLVPRGIYLIRVSSKSGTQAVPVIVEQ